MVLAPLPSQAAADPLVVKIPTIKIEFPAINLRPVVQVLAAPWRFLGFVKSAIDAQGRDISQKSLSLLRTPYTITEALKERIDRVPKQLASLLSAKGNSKSHFARKGSAAEAEFTNYKQIPNSNDQISDTQYKILNTQYSIPDTQYSIQHTNTREIIREVVIKESPPEARKLEANEANEARLSALKDELNQSVTDRLNKFSGPFGFTSNRFDDLTAQKGLTAGSGNIKIIGSSGKIPALSLAYFETVPNIFSSIANASSTVQFTASGLEDKLSFEGSGGITISFDATNKKITFSSVSPTLLNVLQQGADASTFTGTTKIGGLTLTSAGNLTLVGTFAVQGNATSTIENNLHIKGALTVGTSSLGITQNGISASGNLTLSPLGDLQFFSSSNKLTTAGNLTLTGALTVSGNATSTIQGPLVAGSGNVLIIDSTGKIPALSSTYFASVSGANLTSLNADNISSGTLAVARGGTGTTTTFTQGSIVFAGASGIYSQNNTNLFWDNTNNRLGIGTASPSGILHVSNASSTNALVIDSAGNVGIGTATPGSKLTVAGTIESTSGGVKFPDGTTQTAKAGWTLVEKRTLASGVTSTTFSGLNEEEVLIVMNVYLGWSSGSADIKVTVNAYSGTQVNSRYIKESGSPGSTTHTVKLGQSVFWVTDIPDSGEVREIFADIHIAKNICCVTKVWGEYSYAKDNNGSITGDAGGQFYGAGIISGNITSVKVDFTVSTNNSSSVVSIYKR
ncbi:MAG: hypothetical protein HY001_02055 [Candidatus Portnoybacteria bacterium]|nr:hypothetical protein [Candidatus Portnoybacteria bacterium]